VVAYEESSTLEQARERYLADNGFSRGYDEPWVRLRFAGRMVPIFPNTQARVAAVRLHDLHHVATGYATTWTGEGEISAWELASGCGPYLAAWMLNLGGFGIGCWIAPRRVLRAFVRGRHSRNLYTEGFDPARLSQPVGALRRELGLDRPTPAATAADLAAFAGWTSLGLLYALGGTLSLAVLGYAMWKTPRERRAADFTPAARSWPSPASPGPRARSPRTPGP
jgi:hypothetical protein